jgi:release factor glutamine methyltransferase
VGTIPEVNTRPSEPGEPAQRDELASRLQDAGCVAPEEEAGELLEAARGDEELLESLVSRRVAGEPLAWVTGWARFLGCRVRVASGVYVPRWQTEALVRRAIELLPEDGLAADLCTGSGAVAMALARARPKARVVATELDPVACRCAADNGVEVFAGNLADPLPDELRGHFDVVIGVVPYVPTESFAYLPRDVREFEPLLALDGGPGGTRLLEQAVWAGAALLHPGAALLLEVGGEQDEALREVLDAAGYGQVQRHEDDEGDLRGIEARFR